MVWAYWPYSKLLNTPDYSPSSQKSVASIKTTCCLCGRRSNMNVPERLQRRLASSRCRRLHSETCSRALYINTILLTFQHMLLSLASLIQNVNFSKWCAQNIEPEKKSNVSKLKKKKKNGRCKMGWNQSYFTENPNKSNFFRKKKLFLW